jgi:hypothetical protein
MQLVLDAQRDAFLRAHAFREQREEQIRKLRRRQRETLEQIVGLWADFERLRGEVKVGFGGALPSWWRDRLDCGHCPNTAEAEKALRKAPEPSEAESPAAED